MDSTARRIVEDMEAEAPNANQHSAWRATLGLGVVAGLVAVAGLATALGHHPRTTPPPSPAPTPSLVVPPGLMTGLGFSVADDPAAHQVVLFGGLGSARTTWLWDGRRWTPSSPPVSPPSRSGAAAAYDPTSRMVLLFGGSLGPGRSVNDTWAWDGVTWRELNSGLNGPPAGQGAQMAWDVATDQMVLVTDAERTTGAETWTWDGNHWGRATRGDLAVSVFGDAMAYDPVSDALLLVTPVNPDNGNSLTLSWNGSRWRVITDGGPQIEAMTVDPQDGGLLGCGLAIYSASFVVEDNCWEWDGTSWVQTQAAVPPEALKQMRVEAEVTDVGNARLLMFAWLIRAIPGQAQPLHVWFWNGLEWLQVG
jgi:hypothetical protein